MDVRSGGAMWQGNDEKSELIVTIFLTTHYLEEADQLNNTVL